MKTGIRSARTLWGWTLSVLLPACILLGTTAFDCAGSDSDEIGSSDQRSARQVQDPSVPPPDSVTARLFEEVMDYARQEALHERPRGEIMQALGLRFTSMPYLAGVLDAPGEETLVCRLDGFDCVTFVEAALALARTVEDGDYTYGTYARHTRDQRYRGGEMGGYCSRLHYFSDWIDDNEARGNLHNITRDLGGMTLDKRLTFMGKHRSSYPRFATDDSVYQCILDMEQELAGLELHYIPQDHIHIIYSSLQAGDIVAIATSIDGLDVSHTGLVFKEPEGRVGLLHASTSGGVKVSPDLQAYVQNNRNQIGIVVARPAER